MNSKQGQEKMHTKQESFKLGCVAHTYPLNIRNVLKLFKRLLNVLKPI